MRGCTAATGRFRVFRRYYFPARPESQMFNRGDMCHCAADWRMVSIIMATFRMEEMAGKEKDATEKVFMLQDYETGF